MKNRAKCKLCQTIIESFHSTDLVLCQCGEISVDGGDAMRCAAKNWDNFLRVDDNGKEYPVKVQEYSEEAFLENKSKPQTKKELLDMIQEMNRTLNGLSSIAMTAPITHYDLAWLLSLLEAILRSDCASDT